MKSVSFVFSCFMVTNLDAFSGPAPGCNRRVTGGCVSKSFLPRTHHQHDMKRFIGSSFLLLSASALAVEQSTITSDFGSAMPEPESPYIRMGIEEGQLALGVDPNDVVKYIGTREDMIVKVLDDIPSFNRAQAESEVDKMLLDAEVLNLYIQFQKEKEKDPDFEVPAAQEQDEGFFSFRTVVIAYLGYVAYQTLPVVFRNWVAKQEEAGTWHGTNIPFIDDWISQTSADAARTAADAATNVADTVQAVSDAVQSSGLQ